MTTFHYVSGDEVRRGDQVRYHGEPGEVQFVVSERVGDAAMDWYLDEYGGGGLMIFTENFGRVFLTSNDIDESLQFVERGNPSEEE